MPVISCLTKHTIRDNIQSHSSNSESCQTYGSMSTLSVTAGEKQATAQTAKAGCAQPLSLLSSLVMLTWTV